WNHFHHRWRCFRAPGNFSHNRNWLRNSTSADGRLPGGRVARRSVRRLSALRFGKSSARIRSTVQSAHLLSSICSPESEACELDSSEPEGGAFLPASGICGPGKLTLRISDLKRIGLPAILFKSPQTIFRIMTCFSPGFHASLFPLRG